MTATQPLQLVVFEGNPPALGSVAARIRRRAGACCFLCVLRPGEESEPVKRAWMFSIQPIDAGLCLYVIREPRGRTFEGIAEFVVELAETRHAEVDVLFLSEDASWRASRRLARDLRDLQARLERQSPNSLVRRI